MNKRKGVTLSLALGQAIIILPLLFWLIAHTPKAHAADWNVNTFTDATDGNCNDGTCSLRDAVALADPLDTIYLPAGTYSLSSGLGQITIDKALNLTGQGASAANTVIDGNNAIRLFNITSGPVTLTNLTLQNGQPASGNGGAILTSGGADVALANVIMTQNEAPGHGGGIYLAGGTLDILNGSEITYNTAVDSPNSAGGGIYSLQGAINLTDSLVSNNSAQYGGGINLNQVSAQLTINNSQLLNNSGLAPGPTNFPGGAITIQTGSATMNSGLISGNDAFRGAGVMVVSGNFTLNGGTITDNESSYGGGAYVRSVGGLLTINDGAISGNRSTASIFGGGALYIFQGSVVQNGGEINDNTAVNLGGAMEVRQGSFTMNGGTIAGNSAGNWGGAIYNDMGTVTINEGTLTDNYSVLGGGALATGADSHSTIQSSVIYTNSTSITQTGGAILNTGTLTLTNVTLSDNLANNGGGLQNEGTATLNNVTIFGNTAVSNGGGLNENGGTLNIVNTIVAGNSAATGPDCAGTIVSQGYNLIQNSSGCTVSGSSTGNISGNPLLSPLALNGGSTLNHALGDNSPAIDAANNTTCASLDQRGIPRPVDGDNNSTATCDMGAFELGVQIEIGDATVLEGDSGSTTATFTVTRTLQTGGTDTVQYQTATNTATAGDFTAVPLTTLTFNPGEITKTITVDVTGDTNDETVETFFVELSNPSLGVTISRATGTGTIVDDDGMDPPSVLIDDVTLSEGDSGTKIASFTVQLSMSSASAITVDYTTANGTAVAGSDYVATSGTLSFIPGDTEEVINVTINGDAVDEDNETFVVNLSNAINAMIVDSQGKGTITDDDDQPTLTISDATVTEGDSGTVTAQFTVSLSHASSKTITVDVASSDNTATAGSDYTAVATMLTFNAGAPLSQTVAVTVNGDELSEGLETFLLTLSNSSNASIVDGTATGTINDDDTLYVYLPFVVKP